MGSREGTLCATTPSHPGPHSHIPDDPAWVFSFRTFYGHRCWQMLHSPLHPSRQGQKHCWSHPEVPHQLLPHNSSGLVWHTDNLVLAAVCWDGWREGCCQISNSGDVRSPEDPTGSQISLPGAGCRYVDEEVPLHWVKSTAPNTAHNFHSWQELWNRFFSKPEQSDGMGRGWEWSQWGLGTSSRSHPCSVKRDLQPWWKLCIAGRNLLRQP